MPITTIKLDVKTKERLDKLRVYKRETYDEIVQSMLDILNICRVNPEHARGRLIGLDRARKKGRFKSNLHGEQLQAPPYNPESL